jgi:hypothetical protein
MGWYWRRDCRGLKGFIYNGWIEACLEKSYSEEFKNLIIIINE